MYDTNEDTSLSMPQDDHSPEKSAPLDLEPRNRQGKSKDSKETTVTVTRINCPINRYTSIYLSNQRDIVY